MSTPLAARVAAAEKLRPNVAHVRLEMADPPTISYESGQFIILHTAERDGKLIKRSYSIASPPSPNGLDLCVKTVGFGSAYVASLRPGDLVRFSGPWGKGKFTFPEDAENEIVMLATGTGISPLRSHLGCRVAAHPEKRFLLLWGLKREEDVFFREELDALALNHPNFSCRIVLSEPGPSWTGRTGILGEAFEREIGPLAGKEYFLAGNGAMIAAVEARLAAAGVEAERIHREIFFTPPSIPPKPGEK